MVQSFSAKYFNEKFSREAIGAEYSLYPLKELTAERMNELLDRLDGMNVTMPYKQAVIPARARLDAPAAAVGAATVAPRRV